MSLPPWSAFLGCGLRLVRLTRLTRAQGVFVKTVAMVLKKVDSSMGLKDTQDESKVYVHKALARRLQEDVNAIAEKMSRDKVGARVRQTKQARARSANPERFRCPFCKFKAWPAGSMAHTRLLNHCRLHHLPQPGSSPDDLRAYVAPGTKQIKVLSALLDDDAAGSNCRESYLSRSADFIRSCMPESQRWKPNAAQTDRSLILVLDSSGPTYLPKSTFMEDQNLRRVGHTYYTRGSRQPSLRSRARSTARSSLYDIGSYSTRH